MSNCVHRLIALCLAALLAAACPGCGSAGGAQPALIPVKGRITYKGKSLSKGVIHFEPDGFGRKASGQLQSDGTYALTTFKEGDGVVAGQHRVYITEVDKSLAKDRAMKKYSGRNTSGLTADVDAEHTEHNIDLK